jgi:F-type H+-transporting ATPase subunit c
MDNSTWIAIVSILTAGLTIALGCMAPALGEGRAVAIALSSLAQQPDAAIYCFVVAMILIFANPFWTHIIAAGATK